MRGNYGKNTCKQASPTLAAMVGFTDLAHFSKQFKLKEGIAPTYWLQKQPKLKPVSGN